MLVPATRTLTCVVWCSAAAELITHCIRADNFAASLCHPCFTALPCRVGSVLMQGITRFVPSELHSEADREVCVRWRRCRCQLCRCRLCPAIRFLSMPALFLTPPTQHRTLIQCLLLPQMESVMREAYASVKDMLQRNRVALDRCVRVRERRQRPGRESAPIPRLL